MSTSTSERDGAAAPRQEVVTDKLTQSRADLRYLLDKDERRVPTDFPRSKTMKLLTNGGGAALLAIAAGVLLVYRPRLITRAMRVVPMGALMRTLAINLLSRR